MIHRVVTAGTALLAVGCGAQMSSTMLITTPLPASTVFECVQAQAKLRGYDVLQIDKTSFRLVAVRADREVHVADPTFRRGEDRLTAELPEGAGSVTTLRLVAQSFHVFASRRGYEYRERDASDNVRLVAEAIGTECAAEPAPAQSVP